MQRSRRAIVAAAFVAALFLGLGHAIAAPSTKSNSSSAVVAPKSLNGWYSAAEIDNAVHAATVLGQPMVVMLQDSKSTCPKHNAKRDTWLRSPELAGFVRVVAEIKESDQPNLVHTFLKKASGKEGSYIPYLYLGAPSGELLGVVPEHIQRSQLQTTVAEAYKAFGELLPPKAALELWNKLEAGRNHWKSDKIDAALTCFLAVKRQETKNPKLPVFQELRKDEENINQKGAEEVAAAQELLRSGKSAEARTAIVAIRRRYNGFQPAKDAKALLDGKESAVPNPFDAAPIPAETTRRTWSDRSGSHKIEADLIAVEENAVRLKKASGDIVSVPISRLADDDQEYVKQWQAKHGADADNDSEDRTAVE